LLVDVYPVFTSDYGEDRKYRKKRTHPALWKRESPDVCFATWSLSGGALNIM